MAERIYKGDTTAVEASIFEDDGITLGNATSASWIVKRPDGTTDTGGPIVVDSTEVAISYSNTNLPGQYVMQVTFTLPNSHLRSSVITFEVIDPLDTTSEATNDVDKTVDMAWMLLEDLFDSELGGPHLRDVTKNSFNRDKLKRLLPRALYDIGNTFQPAMEFTDVNFPFAAHAPLLSQALLVEGIRHLMRAYVEQYTPVANNVNYFDRRDYLNRWNMVLQIEQKQLDEWLDLFKRDQMGYGDTSILVGGYAGRQRLPRYIAGRFPYIYRW